MPGFFGILSGLLFGLRYAAIIRVSTYRPEPAATPTAPQDATAATEESDAPDSQTQPIEGRASTDITNPNTSTPLLARAQVNVEPTSTSANKWRTHIHHLDAITTALC